MVLYNLCQMQTIFRLLRRTQLYFTHEFKLEPLHSNKIFYDMVLKFVGIFEEILNNKKRLVTSFNINISNSTSRTNIYYKKK